MRLLRRRAVLGLVLGRVLSACSGGEGGQGPTAEATAPIASRPFDFAALDAYLFDGKWKTEGVVVVHEGKVVHERYAAGYTAETRHIAYSVSKSIGAALVGIAVRDGLLRLSDSVCDHVAPTPATDPGFCAITVDDLLRMTSGGRWVEGYGNPSSNVLAMLYGDEPDMGAYVARQPQASAAGTKWLYSSGSSNLLALALKRALRHDPEHRNMSDWAKAELFGPARMASVVFETDRSGTLVFSSSAYLTPRDMARFGQLYLDEGRVGERAILPPGWIAYTRTPAPPVAEERGSSYGGGFWLNTARPTTSPGAWMYPAAPSDTYSAEGHWGQKILIVPSEKLVVVRVGNDREAPFEANPMLETLLGVRAENRVAEIRLPVAPAAAIDARRPAGADEILTGFSSKETCSCAFVVGQSDAYCAAFGGFDGVAIAIAIDRDDQTVTSRFGGVSRTARHTPGGCILDRLP